MSSWPRPLGDGSDNLPAIPERLPAVPGTDLERGSRQPPPSPGPKITVEVIRNIPNDIPNTTMGTNGGGPARGSRPSSPSTPSAPQSPPGPRTFPGPSAPGPTSKPTNPSKPQRPQGPTPQGKPQGQPQGQGQGQGAPSPAQPPQPMKPRNSRTRRAVRTVRKGWAMVGNNRGSTWGDICKGRVGYRGYER